MTTQEIVAALEAVSAHNRILGMSGTGSRRQIWHLLVSLSALCRHQKLDFVELARDADNFSRREEADVAALEAAIDVIVGPDSKSCAHVWQTENLETFCSKCGVSPDAAGEPQRRNRRAAQ